MKLQDYMIALKLSDADLAKMVNRDRSSVTRWRLGDTRPDWDAIGTIKAVTKGAVTADDFEKLEKVAR